MHGLVREGLAKLLRHPICRRMVGDVEVQNFTSTMVDREPDVQQLESDCGDDEEVHPGDDILVIPKEGYPALLLIGIRPDFRHVARDGCEAHSDAELHQFGLDLPRSPAVLRRHPHDEFLDFSRDRGTARTGRRNRSPVPAEPLAMPPDHGLGANDDKVLPPAWPESGERDPERAVQQSLLRPESFPGIGCKLLLQGQVDDCLLATTSDEGEKEVKEQRCVSEQCAHGDRDPARFLGRERV